MRVIKHGTGTAFATIKCPKCCCEFEYNTKTDVKRESNRIGYNLWKESIIVTCPDCDTRIVTYEHYSEW